MHSAFRITSIRLPHTESGWRGARAFRSLSKNEKKKKTDDAKVKQHHVKSIRQMNTK